MRILLDECIPKRLQNSITGHECWTVPQTGLAGKKNGELLELAGSKGVDVLLTVDKAIRHQQNLAGRRIAIVVIRARSNELEDLLPHLPACLAAIGSIKPGEVVYTGLKP